MNLTAFFNGYAEPVLFRLQKPPEYCNLHVEADLGVHKVLIFLKLPGELVQEPLDFIVLGRKLGAVGGISVLEVLGKVRHFLIESEV